VAPTSLLERTDDDLFKDSTMTFGEHLEELRSSLFKAAVALFVGFLVGMYYGDWVVQRIQDPLTKALTRYYQQDAATELKAELELRKQNGMAVPPEFLDENGNVDESAIKQLLVQEGLLFEEALIAPEEVLREIKQHNPKLLRGVEVPAAETGNGLKRENMVRIMLWRKAENDQRLRVKGLNAQEAFVIWLKAAFFTGIVLASPFMFYFIWDFVAAGLYPNEKRYVHVFLPFSILLFLAGASLAFFFVFEPVLNFFFSFNRALAIDPDPRISEWLSFVLLMPLAFGVSFQLPLIMLFLDRIGIFDVESYLSKWRIAVLVIAIASMVLSPGGDPYSMMLMMIPLVFLYFGGIALCKYLPKLGGASEASSRW
jgi:sec-independent protein translocase protein TatC